jgi:hypothetical protein
MGYIKWRKLARKKVEWFRISDFGFFWRRKAEGGGRNEISELINYHVLF